MKNNCDELDIITGSEEIERLSNFRKFLNYAYSHYLKFTEEGKNKYKFFEDD